MANSLLVNNKFSIPQLLKNNLVGLSVNTPLPIAIKRWIDEGFLTYDDAKNYKKNFDISNASAAETIFFNWINNLLAQKRKTIKTVKKLNSTVLSNQYLKQHTKNKLTL